MSEVASKECMKSSLAIVISREGEVVQKRVHLVSGPSQVHKVAEGIKADYKIA